MKNGLKLEERFWTCPECDTYLDRDENAAINILQEGLKILKCRGTDGRSGDDKSSKPVEQEPVIACDSKSHSHAEKINCL